MNEYKKDRPTSEQLVDLLDNELEITICADVVHGLDYEYKQLQEENKKLNGAIQTFDILLKSNVEENKKLKKVIDMVSTRLEYFLIGNLKYQSSQEEFIKLLNILKEVSE